MKKIIIPLVIFAVLMTQLGASFSSEKTPETERPLVKVQPLEAQRVEAQTEVVGTVQALQRAVIAARITGTIEEIPVVLGSEVKKGDLLVKISAGEISARLLQAQAQLEQTRRNLDREKNLLAKMATTTETVKSLEDMYKVAEAAFQEAKTMLDYTSITAPFPGLITLKQANAGDLATPGAPLLSLENHEELQVVTAIPESLVLTIQPGDRLTLKVPAAQQELTGIVAEVAPAADPVSRTAPVKIKIDKAQNVRPGQFARIAIPDETRSTVFIPADAVHTFGQIQYCFTVVNDRTAMRIIRTGLLHGSQYEVLSGLRPGDLLVTESTKRLTDGQPIDISK